jgi:hypothetical protein
MNIRDGQSLNRIAVCTTNSKWHIKMKYSEIECLDIVVEY